MTIINHKDPETGKTWKIPLFEVENPDDLRFLHRDDVYSAIKTSLIRMSENKINRVPCFAIDELVFELTPDSIEENLGMCISYYEEIEEYETCSLLSNLEFE